MSNRTPTLRATAVLAASAALAAAAAGCGGSDAGGVARLGTTTTSAQASPQPAAGDAVAFSGCMRSHGVSRYPDPSSSGAIPKETLDQLGVSSARFQSAQKACRHFLPNGGAGPDAAQVRRVRAQSLSYAECVRAHGVPGFPDPGSDGRIPDPATVGIDQGSPKFEAANQACSRYRPPYMPSNAAYNAYSRQHG